MEIPSYLDTCTCIAQLLGTRAAWRQARGRPMDVTDLVL